MIRVPFNGVSLAGSEVAYMQEAIASLHVSGDGPFTKRVHALLERLVGGPKAPLRTSCTHALEMAALLLDVGPGDEASCRRSPSCRRPTPSCCAARRRCSPTSVPTR